MMDVVLKWDKISSAIDIKTSSPIKWQSIWIKGSEDCSLAGQINRPPRTISSIRPVLSQVISQVFFLTLWL